jgi:predicted dehydrogenase
MNKMRFAVLGCGFWANYQVPGWLELEGVELVALYNRTIQKAEKLAARFGNVKVYDDPVKLLDSEELNFVDIITDVDTHFQFVQIAASKGYDVVCQKPIAPSLEIAKKLVRVCHDNHVKLFINENFRFQAPIRMMKQLMDSGIIGEVFKSRVSFCSAFPVFENQPFLADLEFFILTDIGSHILDVCRYLFGEAATIYCKTKRVNPNIKGEDVANVFLDMKNGIHCYAEMSYASLLEKELFPQTLILVEGTKGSIKLDAGYEIKVTTTEGTRSQVVKPNVYSWIDPEYAVVHSSIVDAQKDILNGLRGGLSENTGDNNFKTVELVFGSYESARSGNVMKLR